MTNKNVCKICKSPNLHLFEHTAQCQDCGVLLYYPYPLSDDDSMLDSIKGWSRESALKWYSASSFMNHHNFTNMLRFMMDESNRNKRIDILDYGGGGGQFALVCKSHFPESTVYITDIADNALLDEWRSLNNQILFSDFDADQRKFDFVFMNDVFEHVSDPAFVLRQLAGKLKREGKIFIDTPKQFWIYPFSRFFSKELYAKILRGTVSTMHLQIWSRKSFDYIVNKSGLKPIKYIEVSEYTMPPQFYMNNMGIRNPIIRLAGFVFYKNARYLAKNKIMSILSAR